MKKSIILITLIFALLTLSGCAIIAGDSGSGLDGTAWTLESYGGKTLIGETAMTANFDSGEVTGSTSCNHYFGSYKVKGEQFTVEGLGWTEMACMDPEGIMEQESTIMAMLSTTVSYVIQGGKLHLQLESGDELVFSPLESTD